MLTKLQPKVSLVEPENGAHMQISKMAKPRLGTYVVSHQGSRSWCVSAYLQGISDIGLSYKARQHIKDSIRSFAVYCLRIGLSS